MDDGTSINELGSDLSRDPAELIDPELLDPNVNVTDLGTG